MKKLSLALLVIAALLVGLLPAAVAQDEERVSRFGEYSGYSEAIYDGYARTSQYVEVRDGTRLAVDIFRPTLASEVVTDPLPVVWTHHRYHRVTEENGQLITLIDSYPDLTQLLYHGYVIGVVDVRGGGASFGTREGEFTPAEALDAYDMTEWFAAQPWCSGNVGMFGISYLAITQYMAASTQPPHLKAIFPQMAMFDLYSFVYPGGVFNENFLNNWGGGTFMLDRLTPAVPVDDDPDGVLLAEARKQHKKNWNIIELTSNYPFRDAQGSPTGIDVPLYVERSPSSFINEINASGVAIYHLGGWYDIYPRDPLVWFNNLTVPQKVVMTHWNHEGSGDFDLLAEHLRWFDYWLKDIDNGIMDEPPITYRVMGADEWRTTDTWPLPSEQRTPFYLGEAGTLTSDAPASDTASDSFQVDYTATTGTATRWTNGFGGPFGYPLMNEQAKRSLAYTTEPFAENVEITGHPVMHLWVTSTAEDGDFFAYLEEVDAAGNAYMLSEGVLRASHRALHDAPWNYLDLPYHRGFAEDVQPLLAGEPVELVFEITPTSNVFEAGSSLRVRIAGADADNFGTPELEPPPVITLYRDAAHASYIELPVIPAQ